MNPATAAPDSGSTESSERLLFRVRNQFPPPAAKTTVFKEVTESKWCDQCKKMGIYSAHSALSGHIRLQASA